MKKIGLLLTFCLLLAVLVNAQTITPKAKKVQKYGVDNNVIAHRGTTFWAPELTEAAFRWARNIGADYVELDVHRSKDGVLIIMHDRTFKRTTDVAKKFPGRENDYIETFTFDEIVTLDAGSNFNENLPNQARQSFVGLDVLVFEDVFRIAEGKRIKRDADGNRLYHKDAVGNYVFEYEIDPADNGNRPGVYIETKYPEFYPGLEEQIYGQLARIGWNPLEGDKIKKGEPSYKNERINVGPTKGKILLQTFSRPGMQNFKRVFNEKVQVSFLVSSPTPDNAEGLEAMDEIVAFTVGVGAQFIGTNQRLSPEFSEKIRTAGLKVNVYSFNTTEEMEKFFGLEKGNNATPLLNGMITNRADLSIQFYNDKEVRNTKIAHTPDEILRDIGYGL